MLPTCCDTQLHAKEQIIRRVERPITKLNKHNRKVFSLCLFFLVTINILDICISTILFEKENNLYQIAVKSFVLAFMIRKILLKTF